MQVQALPKRYASRRSPVMAANVISTSHPLASQAGLRMIERGGNAVDAALAAAITLTVVEPTGNGLGSDGFCIVSDGAALHGLNASGRSPAGWSPERFARLEAMPERGFESVTVPGAVAGWVDLSRRFGALPFADLFGPAIEYAEEGFIVTPMIGELWRRGAATLKDLPGFAEGFMRGGRAPRPGERFVNAPLANSLRLIAETEGRAFYEGELAERIAAFAAEHGACLTVEDLAAHRNEWCGTIGQSFGDSALHEIPPNGQGIAALMALGILGGLGIEDLDPDSGEAIHLQIEAMKLALADLHRYVADPGHMGMTARDLLDPGYLSARARLIDRRRAQVFGAGAPVHGGTVCLSAGDSQGMMVSYIQSNYSGFGSGIVVPETGISLQNRGFGFTLEEGHPNRVGGAKRPLHTIIPGFISRDGRDDTAFGIMGGPMQAQGHVQLFLRMQVWDQDPQSAADAPRWRFIKDNTTALEDGVSPEAEETLREMGHSIVREPPEEVFGFGGAQIVKRLEGGGYSAGSDPRKDGQAVGV
jgi:gamma-glutamyltranspeptidase/glutathione hydrolase